MDIFLGITIPFLIGVVFFVYAEWIGKLFCKLGKLIWRLGTFGLTDMNMFYQDAHAKIVFKMFGVLFMIGAIVFAAFSIYIAVAK